MDQTWSSVAPESTVSDIPLPNLTTAPGWMVSVTPEGTGSVRLQGHGAFAGAFADMDAVAPAKGKALRGKPRMALKGANLVRCMHMKDAPEFRFKVRGDLRDLRLLVRTEVDSIAVLLDGEPDEGEDKDAPKKENGAR